MVALISVFLVTVAMSMAALTLANAQRVLHGDGGQESAESHAESAEKEGVQAGSVGAEGLGLIAPDFVPARRQPVRSTVQSNPNLKAHLSHGSFNPWRPRASFTSTSWGTLSTL